MVGLEDHQTLTKCLHKSFHGKTGGPQGLHTHQQGHAISCSSATSQRQGQAEEPAPGWKCPVLSPPQSQEWTMPKVKSHGGRQQPERHLGPTACGRVYRTVSEEVLGLGCLSVSGPAWLPAPPLPPTESVPWVLQAGRHPALICPEVGHFKEPQVWGPIRDHQRLEELRIFRGKGQVPNYAYGISSPRQKERNLPIWQPQLPFKVSVFLILCIF